MRIIFSLLLLGLYQLGYSLPAGFVYLSTLESNIIEDLRYASSNNFMGHPIPGYQANRCILTQQAAEQLAKVQKAALKQGYRLKVYDCYRPTTAVNAFYRWSKNPQENQTKAAFYPREEKKNLFAQGYLAKGSGHSRGSTVDLTLVKIGANKPSTPAQQSCYGKTTAYLNDNSIDTGTRFDCMDRSAHVNYPEVTKEQKANRLLLRQLMMAYGFKPYSKEWWHFTLKEEPYPNRYFDFPVQ